MTDSLSPVSPGLADLIASVAWTADPKNGRFGMTLEQEEVELLAQHFARQSPMVATAAAAERGEELLPANVKALELSIASVDRFMDSDDAHILIPEHGEAILLILHELKRLRSSTDAAPVAGEGLPALLEPTVELARRNIMREQTDFIGRMHQAMGGYEVACEEWADGEGDDAGRDDAAENLTELIGLALAQLAMVCNPTDPLAALSHPPATDTLVAMERRILAAECASQRILNDLADECERAEVKSELEWLVSLAKDSVETAHAVKEIDASAAKVIAALSQPPATDTAQAEPTQRRLADAEGAQQNEADGAEALYRGPC